MEEDEEKKKQNLFVEAETGANAVQKIRVHSVLTSRRRRSDLLELDIY